MKKRYGLILTGLLFAVLLSLTACGHKHTWVDATCTSPKTCSECGETEGEALGHKWKDATCTKPKTCSVCGETDGEALGHKWKDATCTEPKTCTVCGETDGKALGHSVEGMTCTTGGICSLCGEDIEAPGHDWKDATCTTPKTCSVCGETEGEALGHTTSNGICERCNQEIHEPIVYSGYGDSVVQSVSVPSGMYKVTLFSDGSSNFIVHIYTPGGDEIYLANEIGYYVGSSVVTDNIDGSIIEVTSNGNWSITFNAIEDGGTSTIVGNGDCVSPWFTLEKGALIVNLTNDGSSNFIVHVFDENGRRYTYLANEIGPYSGSVVFNKASAGTKYCLEVVSNGYWSVDFGLGDAITQVTP